tara:strand:+ start:2400 stop:2738 length:339 start_codon:yes stop_codon:yes gene_type:complete
MIWPPVKAWTSKFDINGHFHFVAINYGGELLKRWVLLMSVIDSNVVVKVSWSQLLDSLNWESGWYEINYLESSNFSTYKGDIKTTKPSHLSNDSGLTIPITKDTIRPWFDKI